MLHSRLLNRETMIFMIKKCLHHSTWKERSAEIEKLDTD